MSYEDVLAWGEIHHYPFLALGKGSRLRHGRAHYEALREHPVRLRRAVKRIERWNALVLRCQVDSTMMHVDNMLKTHVDKSTPENILA